MPQESRSRRLVSYRSGRNMDNPVHIHTFDNMPLMELPRDLMDLARETLNRTTQGDGQGQAATRNSRTQYDDATEFSADVYMNNPLHIFRHSQSTPSERPPVNIYYSHPSTSYHFKSTFLLMPSYSSQRVQSSYATSGDSRQYWNCQGRRRPGISQQFSESKPT